jgi:hypothetical protein
VIDDDTTVAIGSWSCCSTSSEVGAAVVVLIGQQFDIGQPGVIVDRDVR